MTRDVNPISLISNGGGSSCIHGEGLGVHGGGSGGITRLAALILAALLLSGCAGLSVNFDANISYRSDVPLGTRK